MHQQIYASSQQRYVNRTSILRYVFPLGRQSLRSMSQRHVQVDVLTCCNKVCQVAGEKISFAEVQGQQSLSITVGLGSQGFEVVDLPVVDQNHLKHNGASLPWSFRQVVKHVYIYVYNIYMSCNPEIPSALLFADAQLITSTLSLHCPANHTTELYECHNLRMWL